MLMLGALGSVVFESWVVLCLTLLVLLRDGVEEACDGSADAWLLRGGRPRLLGVMGLTRAHGSKSSFSILSDGESLRVSKFEILWGV